LLFKHRNFCEMEFCVIGQILLLPLDAEIRWRLLG
jgi:hypothetical protein